MKYFGTDGFRGRANIDLTVDHAFKIGKYLGWYFCKKIKCNKVSCVIGKDTRKSSYMFEYALAAGLSSTGANVYLLHVTTTPNVSYVVKTENFNFGIMVTASHNPFFDNGIKIIDKNPSLTAPMDLIANDELECIYKGYLSNISILLSHST